MLTAEQRMYLANSTEFQQFLASDKQMESLARNRTDPGRRTAGVLDFLGCPNHFRTYSLHPLTPAVWSLLWVVGNHYVIDCKGITEADTDVFLWLLRHDPCEPLPEVEKIPLLASGIVLRLGLEYPEAAGALLDMVCTAFEPLRMLPDSFAPSPAPAEYGADWLAQISSVAAGETNLTIREVLQKMPLSVCCHYYLTYLRKQGVRGIAVRTDSRIAGEMMDCAERLGECFLKRKMQKKKQEKEKNEQY